MTLDEPLGCKVASTLETTAHTDEVRMGITAGHMEEAYDRFFVDRNEAGEEVPFVTLKLSECATAGGYKVSGTVTGRSPNATGDEKQVQVLRFSETDQTNGGGALTMGGKTAVPMGEVEHTIPGAPTDKNFSAK